MEAAHQVGAMVEACSGSANRPRRGVRGQRASVRLPGCTHSCAPGTARAASRHERPLAPPTRLTCLQVVMLWLWLSYRFDPEVFPQQAEVGGLGWPCWPLMPNLAPCSDCARTNGPRRRTDLCCLRDGGAAPRTLLCPVMLLCCPAFHMPPLPQVEAKAEHICGLLDKGLRRLTRMSKSGIDIAELVRHLVLLQLGQGRQRQEGLLRLGRGEGLNKVCGLAAATLTREVP